MSTMEMLACINNQDQTVALRVRDALPAIAQAVDLLEKRLTKGGRLVYVGAGTSGRLGFMDAAECRPTYGIGDDTVSCVMAGGQDAVFHANEQLEDKSNMAREDLVQWGLTPKDVVVAAAASGRTPYCISALDYARSIGAGAISIACNLQSEMSDHADVSIEVATGAEVVMGSTRMKAGTAQKLIMNMISTAVMIKLGRTYDNLMIMINSRNVKANNRVLRLFEEAVGKQDPYYAEEMLAKAEGNLSIAVLMDLTGQSYEICVATLAAHNGHFLRALEALNKIS